MKTTPTSPLSLSPALRVGTFRRRFKCESRQPNALASCSSFSTICVLVITVSSSCGVRLSYSLSLSVCLSVSLSLSPPIFLPCSGVSMTMSWPCAQTCTPESTRSGFTSGSGTWRLQWPTASRSSTWWRATVCTLTVWDHSSTLRGPTRKVLDGNAPAPISDTTATAIRWANFLACWGNSEMVSRLAFVTKASEARFTSQH